MAIVLSRFTIIPVLFQIAAAHWTNYPPCVLPCLEDYTSSLCKGHITDCICQDVFMTGVAQCARALCEPKMNDGGITISRVRSLLSQKCSEFGMSIMGLARFNSIAGFGIDGIISVPPTTATISYAPSATCVYFLNGTSAGGGNAPAAGATNPWDNYPPCATQCLQSSVSSICEDYIAVCVCKNKLFMGNVAACVSTHCRSADKADIWNIMDNNCNKFKMKLSMEREEFYSSASSETNAATTTTGGSLITSTISSSGSSSGGQAPSTASAQTSPTPTPTGSASSGGRLSTNDNILIGTIVGIGGSIFLALGGWRLQQWIARRGHRIAEEANRIAAQANRIAEQARLDRLRIPEQTHFEREEIPLQDM